MKPIIVFTDLDGPGGNAFNILAGVKKILIENGQEDLVEDFLEDAMSGDHDHLWEVVHEYCEVKTLDEIIREDVRIINGI